MTGALAAAAGRRPRLSVFGTDYPTPDGTAVRDYIHIEDLGDAHLLALKHLRGGGGSECLNLGNGTGYSVQSYDGQYVPDTDWFRGFLGTTPAACQFSFTGNAAADGEEVDGGEGGGHPG